MDHKSEPTGSEPFPLPVLPIRDIVVFPYMVVPLSVGRERSVRALDAVAGSGNDRIILLTQKDEETDDPLADDLYAVGVVAEIKQQAAAGDDTLRLVVEGVCRVRIEEFATADPYLMAFVRELAEPSGEGPLVDAHVRLVTQRFEQAVRLGKEIPPEALMIAKTVEDPSRLADLVASYFDLPVYEKQEILEILSPLERLQRLTIFLTREIELLRLDRDIENRVREEVGESQKEYYLRERMKAIQEELGERDAFVAEIDELRARIEEAAMPAEVEERALKELDRLERMPPVAPEATVVRTYLDWLCDLPWNRRTRDKLDIERAETILDEDHYGLQKVKDRVLEFLAVRKLRRHAKGPILCFVGPPGVGKTSIGKSIARAMGREFIRVSLGGVRDEAEIRGHRRTYIGALPGRIIQTIRRAGSRNPVFMLDEIDKIGVDFRGDPASALLEALDPEQNDSFSDHFLEVPFDLSEVMFIATGNLMEPIPPALRDRMEIIDFSGYVESEKLCIAKQFLVPKQITEHGLRTDKLRFSDLALQKVVRSYTREAGVRNLEREIGSICRKVARETAAGKREARRITPATVRKYLGPEKFLYGVAQENDEIGVATGLAWSEVGGDILSIEVGLIPGSGEVLLTGQLGDVMQESARAALSYTRSRSADFGVAADFYKQHDIHVHVPAGAIPKDGPSAGIAIATGLCSAVSGCPVRRDVAMTGEITLRGRVLPVGGVKEKILAAHRAGLTNVILPRENEKDLDDLPPYVNRKLTFHHVATMDEVLEIALARATTKPSSTRRTSRAKTATGSSTRHKPPERVLRRCADSARRLEENLGLCAAEVAPESLR